MPTGIPYLDEVCNPLGWGCYGPGGTADHPKRCGYCYAAVLARRKLRNCPDCRAFVPHWHPEQLERVACWKKPRRVGIQFMGDLFGSGVPDEHIICVYKAMLRNRQHTYLLLTKHPERMRSFATNLHEAVQAAEEAAGQGKVPKWFAHIFAKYITAPNKLGHIWYGVTVENQAAADERIPLLLQTPAAVRFVSLEPLLSDINLTNLGSGHNAFTGEWSHYDEETGDVCTHEADGELSWAIIGPESGPRARPCDPAWVESIIAQCRAARVPVWIKGKLFDKFPVQEYPNVAQPESHAISGPEHPG